MSGSYGSRGSYRSSNSSRSSRGGGGGRGYDDYDDYDDGYDRGRGGSSGYGAGGYGSSSRGSSRRGYDNDDDYDEQDDGYGGAPRGSGSYGGRGASRTGRSSSRANGGYGGYSGANGNGYGSSGRNGSNGTYDGYGGYGGYGQAAPPAQRPGAPGNPVWGQAAASSQRYYGRGATTTTRDDEGTSRRGLWIGLVVVLALLAALGGGGYYAYGQYKAPGAAATQFCAAMQSQSYDKVYLQLSAAQRSQITDAQFTEAAKALDAINGKVGSCKVSSSSNGLLKSTATAAVAMTRAPSVTPDGYLHLKNEAGGWHVDSMDAGLLGVTLGALVAADGFCDAITTQKYADAYALLGSALTGGVSQDNFIQQYQWRDAVDGTAATCALSSVSDSGATSGTPSIVMALKRGKLGVQQGTFGLDAEGGAWKIASVGMKPTGTDLSALWIGKEFCDDLAKPDYADAYTVMDSHFTGGLSETQMAALFSGTSAASHGLIWKSCTLDASTYVLSPDSTKAVYKMTVTFASKATGATTQVTKLYTLVYVNKAWKLHGVLVTP
jgi:hypothetical protein